MDSRKIVRQWHLVTIILEHEKRIEQLKEGGAPTFFTEAGEQKVQRLIKELNPAGRQLLLEGRKIMQDAQRREVALEEFLLFKLRDDVREARDTTFYVINEDDFDFIFGESDFLDIVSKLPVTPREKARLLVALDEILSYACSEISMDEKLPPPANIPKMVREASRRIRQKALEN